MSIQPTCQDRLVAHLNSRIEDLQQLWAAEMAGNDDGVEDLGTLHEYGLAFDYVAPGTFTDQRRGYFCYQLSTGGPGDEFRFYLDERLHLTHIEYWFLDWFDGAHETLTGERETLLTEIFQWFAELSDLRHMIDDAE